MRPLTEDETRTLFIKLSEYIGKSIEKLINRGDERHCFRLIKVSQKRRVSCCCHDNDDGDDDSLDDYGTNPSTHSHTHLYTYIVGPRLLH